MLKLIHSKHPGKIKSFLIDNSLQSVPSAKRQRPSEDCSDDFEDATMNYGVSGRAPKWTVELTRKEKEGSCCKNVDKEKMNDLKEEKKECGDEIKMCFDEDLASEV